MVLGFNLFEPSTWVSAAGAVTRVATTGIILPSDAEYLLPASSGGNAPVTGSQAPGAAADAALLVLGGLSVFIAAGLFLRKK